eukprot:CAMPEP_0176370204 /NCGR_PEP_ID=MMETSP0126-20121128/23819_1 /TAXON_ID=141414 ORGANISM="Strombidinopsis acuminatum, Strain SPMC142" /NCGR_SAMPLE_ID=MMETSP0126 /ASSEMBLY_ACC=CAM_ASM_000229 /LENGTH=35 /DNA_ID= /DNA_START= /DNA_END= /DNA_ORIENTATION=
MYPPSLKSEISLLDGGLDVALSNFGHIQYGTTIMG